MASVAVAATAFVANIDFQTTSILGIDFQTTSILQRSAVPQSCSAEVRRGPPGGPEEGGERYQHFEEIVGALRAQFFRSELMHIGFLMIFEVFASGASFP